MASTGRLRAPHAMDAHFPRSARVRTRAEYARVFDRGRRIHHPWLSLHWSDDGQPPRLGLAVSRKVDPHAVARNRIKRALREQFRALRPLLAAGEYVVVARQAAAAAPAAELRAALVALLQRAGALPPSDAGGTMPAVERKPAATDPVQSAGAPSSSMPRPRAG